MKIYRTLALLLAVAMAATLVGTARTSAAAATKTVKFKGSYSGTASLLIENSSVKILAVKGDGTASIIGKSKLSGTGAGTGATGLCVPFKGKGSIKSSKGTIKFSVNATKSQGCSSGQSGPVTVTVTGTAKITGGSGAAAGAKGTLKYKGTMDLKDTSGTQTGTYTGTVSGNVTVNK